MGYLPQYNALDKQFPISVYEVVLSGLSKSKKLFARYTKAQHQQVLDTLGAITTHRPQGPTYRSLERRTVAASAPRPCHRRQARCRDTR